MSQFKIKLAGAVKQTPAQLRARAEELKSQGKNTLADALWQVAFNVEAESKKRRVA